MVARGRLAVQEMKRNLEKQSHLNTYMCVCVVSVNGFYPGTANTQCRLAPGACMGRNTAMLCCARHWGGQSRSLNLHHHSVFGRRPYVVPSTSGLSPSA